MARFVMIVCSCNVLSEAAIRECLTGENCPRTPNAVYRCMGCSPNCGRCAKTLRALINQVMGASPQPACASACPHKAGSCTVDTTAEILAA